MVEIANARRDPMPPARARAETPPRRIARAIYGGHAQCFISKDRAGIDDQLILNMLKWNRMPIDDHVGDLEPLACIEHNLREPIAQRRQCVGSASRNYMARPIDRKIDADVE